MADPRAHVAAASRRAPTAEEIEQYLAENTLLIEAILQNQNAGRLHECVSYQLQLQQNLLYLATYADQHPSLQPLVFALERQGPAWPPSGDTAAASADAEGS